MNVEGLSGNNFELIIEFKKTDAKKFGVKICNSPDGDETTMVFYDTTEKKLKVDSTKSSSGRSSGSVECAPLGRINRRIKA